MKLLRYKLWDFKAFGVGAILMAVIVALRVFGL